jgi:MFS superfamily sulfate permease-like transporter
MNDWLSVLMPDIWWFRLHVFASLVAGVAIFYILEQMVVYGSSAFSNITVSIYRFSLAVLLVGVATDALEHVASRSIPRPPEALIIIGLAVLACVIAVTHKSQHRFGE